VAEIAAKELKPPVEGPLDLRISRGATAYSRLKRWVKR
jgi:hypothetical protein